MHHWPRSPCGRGAGRARAGRERRTEDPRRLDVASNEFVGQGDGRLSKRVIGALLAAACAFVVLGVVVIRGGEEDAGAPPAAAARAPEDGGAAAGTDAGEVAGGDADADASDATAAAPNHAAEAAEVAGPAEPEAAPAGDGNGAAGDGGAAPLPPAPVRPSAPPEYGEPVPPEARVPTPDAVRGIYLRRWAAGSRGRRGALIELAEATEINSFVIDVKDATGYVSYRTRSELAREIGADREIRIADIRGVLDDLRERGIYPI